MSAVVLLVPAIVLTNNGANSPLLLFSFHQVGRALCQNTLERSNTLARKPITTRHVFELHCLSAVMS
jgi:hypothetical protein